MSQNFKFLGVIFTGFAISGLILALKYNQPNSGSTALPPARASSSDVIPTPTPTPRPNTSSSEVTNSDASLKLTMKSTRFADHADYVFYVSKGDGSDQRMLYTKTLNTGASMSIHHNSWSPDYKEVLLVLKDGSLTRYLVFKANGEDYNQGDKFLDVSTLFAKTQTNLTLAIVTGWDGYGLLHVVTDRPSGGRGPNFWFVTGTRQFLELAKAPNE